MKIIKLGQQELENNYPFLRVAQYIASVLIIMIHCGMSGLLFSPPINFFFLCLLCKTAVPLFLISTGYFVRKKASYNASYSAVWRRRQLKSYVCWSVIYLPYGLIWLIYNFHLLLLLYPISLLIGFLYLGTYYHLWYFPALFLGMIISSFDVKKLGYRVAFFLATLFYSFGLIETYLSFLQGTEVALFFMDYQKIFFTPRNGLFYTPLFLLLGFAVFDFQKSSFLNLRMKEKFVFSAILMGVEGCILYFHQGFDTNFLISCPLFLLFFFCWLFQRKAQKVPFFLDLWKFKEYTKYYFFIHLIPLEGLNFFLFKNVLWRYKGFLLFLGTWLLTHLLSFFVIRLKEIKRKNQSFLSIKKV